MLVSMLPWSNQMLNHRGTGAQRDTLSEKVIGAAITVHRALGPGLLESAYEACLELEIKELGLRVERQVEVPLHYKTIKLDAGYRLDLLVERELILELKTVEKLLAIHQAQLLTYLKLTGISTGLLMNFHVAKLADGIKRLKL
jgi:GxxExxY protein